MKRIFFVFLFCVFLNAQSLNLISNAQDSRAQIFGAQNGAQNYQSLTIHESPLFHTFRAREAFRAHEFESLAYVACFTSLFCFYENAALRALREPDIHDRNMFLHSIDIWTPTQKNKYLLRIKNDLRVKFLF